MKISQAIHINNIFKEYRHGKYIAMEDIQGIIVLARIGHLVIDRRCGNLFAYSDAPQTLLNFIHRFFGYITFSL